MKRLISGVLLTLACSCSLMAEEEKVTPRMSLKSVLPLGLPVVEITTVDGEEPTAEEAVKPDERCSGRTIVNATKVPGRIIVWSADSTRLYDSGEYVQEKSGMTVKIRGNNSAFRPQKPYKIKLQKKADLLVRGNPQQFRDKNWLLMKEWRNTLNTPIGLKMNELLGVSWTPACQQVNVLFNGEYRGIYMLIEQVRRNERCRINVDEQTGYIIERDIYWWVAPLWFQTTLYNTYWQRYTFKYPDEDEVTPEQVEYIRRAVEEMEDEVRNPEGEYERYLDVESHAAWILGHDILGTEDAGGSNRYLSKYDNTPESKFRMETIWDFDTNFYRPGEWSRLHVEAHTYALRLFQSRNRAFAKAYVRAWQRLSPVLEEQMSAFLDSLAGTDETALNASRQLEGLLGYRTYVSFRQNVDEAKAWFASRRKWMDVQVAQIDTADTHVCIWELQANSTHGSIPSEKSVNSKSVNDKSFDLSGRRIPALPARRGIYIKDGRKVMIK